MSGGVAYVFDLATQRLNTEMVDLDPLDEDDRAFLREVVTKHAAETASTVAAGLLAEWDEAVERFSKIMPRDYKRVLEAARDAEREGVDVDEAIMAAAHG
jgi:glutamate synthase (NADPH/NADH) large chain